MKDSQSSNLELVVNRPVHYVIKGTQMTPCGLHVLTPAVYTQNVKYVTCSDACKEFAEQYIQKEVQNESNIS